MPPPPPTLLLSLIIFIFTEFSASSPKNLGRRILHQQPFFPQSNTSSPPPPPPVPFTTAAPLPSTTPFFPSLPSPPPPPLSNFASFLANLSSLNVSNPHSSSSPKLLILTLFLLLLALFLSFFAVYFFIYKKRRQSGCFTEDGKATDHSSTSSSKQQQSRNHGNSRRTNPDNNANSRTSSEFLYLGTLVNNQNSRGYDNPRLIVNKNIFNVHSSNASSHDASSRKWDSPDLNPLPPLSRNSNIPVSTEVGSSCHTFVVSNNSNVSNTSSRYDAEEEFYSPRGSLGGGGDSVGTRSSSRRDLNAVDNFDGKKFSSSSSRSSTSSSSSGSPARSVSISISPPVSLSPIRPKSPELVEMDVLVARPRPRPRPRPPLMQPQQDQPTFMVGLESASDDDGASLSSLSSKRSALDSARTSNQSDGNVAVGLNGFQNRLDCDSKSSSFSSAEKDPVDRLSGLDGNVRSQAQMPQPLMTQLESSSSSSPERDPVVSVIGSSDDNERSQGQLLLPVVTQLEGDRESSFSFSPEREVNELPMIPDASDHIHNEMTQPHLLHPFMTQLESHSKLSFSLSSERNVIESPRTSNASDCYVKSSSRIPSPDDNPLISSSPERNRIELSRISVVSGHVKSVRSSSRISGPNHQHRQPIPLPPPLPPPFLAGRQGESHTPSPSPNATAPLGLPPALETPSRPFEVHSLSEISPFELPTSNCKTAEKTEDTTNIKTLESREETSNFETPGKDTDALKHESLDKSEHTPKPKLKTLHWDKVKANSDREMVWDQLKCSSFKLNEEMIETLFVVNNKNPKPKEVDGDPVFSSPKQESNRVLDPKKSQNIAISLRALNVPIEEVHEALVEGNVDLLGTELLESLQKMAPTKEEERKLKEYSNDLPFKLGPAERFLKAVLDIPYAFKRVDAMLYVANFDSEVEYLKKSFETLEAACEELRNSRMFLKLLEAVLKTGNRMNVGTNRGDAHAFKLDTLLKLVDVKGADGKTTLLHFVVQEIIKAEGTRLSTVNQGLMSAYNEDVKCRKLGLQVVSSLSSDLSNVKKGAAMDSEVVSSEVAKLSRGIEHIREIVQLNNTNEKEENNSKFAESMDKFISTAEEEIIRIQAQESVALSLVKEITEYFHGDSAKEEAHPFRIFMVVRDFLAILDGVCKEVGTINERTMISSAHKFPVPVNPMLPSTLYGIPAKQQFSSPYNYDSASP